MKFPGRWLSLLAFSLTGFAAEAPRLTPLQRLQPAQLQATHEAVQRFARERAEVPVLGAYEDFRAVLGVEAEDPGQPQPVLAAAQRAGVRVVVYAGARPPKPASWLGLRDGVLFLNGSSEGDGKPGGLKLASALAPGVREHLETTAKNSEAWRKLVESFQAQPDAIFAAGSDYQSELMAKWDREAQGNRSSILGVNDARQKVRIDGTLFDPFEVSFRHLSTHLLLREVSEVEVRAALREGRSYVAHDWLCDPTGFAFGAVNNLGVFPMGATATMQGTTRVVALTPLAATLKLFHHGKLLTQTNGTNLTFTAKKPGAYRVEAWLTVGGEERPWIYANPVYLEESSIFSLPLPAAMDSTNVTEIRDFAYTEGPPVEAAKQKLDLYVPHGAKAAPVFIFLHGGAWRFGDRGLYPPVGHRFAKEGILTVIPSYRLAPKHKWPAQAEDSAAALAWTVRHIARHGGDTNRIFIGGHSAGGHLSSLLVFNDRFLKPFGLAPSLVRGVVSLSGVYNLDIGDVQTAVFGKDRDVRRDASPLFFVKAMAPPFLVSYCQWDYPTLPAQAKIFHAALQGVGVSSELVFTPKENHIYEMIALTHDADPTAQAVAKFIKSR